MIRKLILAGTVLALLLAGFLDTRDADSPTSNGTQLALELGGADSASSDLAGELAPASLASETEGRRHALPAEPEPQAAKRGKKSKQSTAPIGGPTLRGVVVDENGMSVADAEVTIAGQLKAGSLINIGSMALNETAQSDSQGRFRVPRGYWPKAEVKVTLKARGHLLVDSTATPESASGSSDLGTFVVQRCVILGGVLLDSEGQPVQGAKLWRTDPGAGQGMPVFFAMANKTGRFGPTATTSDELGHFELAHEKSGSYEIHADHEDHPPGLFSGTAPETGTQDLSLRLQLEAGAQISGRLLDFPPLRKGVTVQALPLHQDSEQENSPMLGLMGGASGSSHKGTPDSTGHFVVKGLKLGEKYKLQAFVRDGIMNSVACSDEKTSETDREGIELQWDEGARVRFRLQDAESGEPIAGGEVRYRWTDGDQGMMANGRKMQEFSTSEVLISELRPNPSPGAFELAIISDGYLEKRVLELSVKENELLDIGTISLHKSPNFRVQVLEASSGKPIRHARVVLRPDTEGDKDNATFGLGSKLATGKTDKEGWCVLEACSSVTATLSVRRKGFAPMDLEGLAMPTSGEQAEVVRLAKGSKILVTVLEDDGKPAVNVGLIHKRPDGSRETRRTPKDGTLAFKDQLPGEHQFKATRAVQRRFGARTRTKPGEDDDENWRSVQIAGGAQSSLTIQLVPTTGLAGRVTLRGAPVPQAKISLLPGEELSQSDELRAEFNENIARLSNQGSSSSTTTDSKGEFQLDKLKAGKYQLRVTRRGTPAHYVSVDLGPTENHVDVELPSSAVEGRVADDRGRPVAGAEVRLRRVRESEAGADQLGAQRLRMASSFFGGSGGIKNRTDASGRYQIEGIPTGVKLAVDVQAQGFVDGSSEAFEANKNQQVKAKAVKLAPAGSIKVLAAGSDMMFEIVYARREAGEGESPQRALAMVRAGSARLQGLAPGQWHVSKELNGEGQLVLVQAGEEAEAELLPE